MQDWVSGFEERPQTPWLHFFERDPITCWPAGFSDQPGCRLYLGQLTARMLPPLLEQKPAQEFLQNYGLWLQLDGAEATSV